MDPLGARSHDHVKGRPYAFSGEEIIHLGTDLILCNTGFNEIKDVLKSLVGQACRPADGVDLILVLDSPYPFAQIGRYR